MVMPHELRGGASRGALGMAGPGADSTRHHEYPHDAAARLVRIQPELRSGTRLSSGFNASAESRPVPAMKMAPQPMAQTAQPSSREAPVQFPGLPDPGNTPFFWPLRLAKV